MFGYIKACPSHLSDEDKKQYSAFYCGLCKEMGRQLGKWSRVTLTFDATFLALLHASLSYDLETDVYKEVCAINPFKKVECTTSKKSLEFASQMSAALAYYKVVDTSQDEKGAKKILASTVKPIFEKSLMKIPSEFDELLHKIIEELKNQSTFENNKETNTDIISMSSANSLGYIFLEIPHGKAYEDSLFWFGFFLGRWVYLIDAVDDYDDDIKKNSYNVFAEAHKGKEKEFVLKEAEKSLNSTLFHIAKHYRNLPLKRYSTILDNIIFMGLKTVQTQILNKED